jgi:hypothetical protein
MSSAASRTVPWFVQSGKKIVAVGRNYQEHAAELGNAVPTKPMLFLKPTSSYILEGEAIKIPKGCFELHHEVELGIKQTFVEKLFFCVHTNLQSILSQPFCGWPPSDKPVRGGSLIKDREVTWRDPRIILPTFIFYFIILSLSCK